jgi:hypothetical protein
MLAVMQTKSKILLHFSSSKNRTYRRINHLNDRQIDTRMLYYTFSNFHESQDIFIRAECF